jgi:hypothetical protein
MLSPKGYNIKRKFLSGPSFSPSQGETFSTLHWFLSVPPWFFLVTVAPPRPTIVPETKQVL